jgi:hypothetical protein
MIFVGTGKCLIYRDQWFKLGKTALGADAVDCRFTPKGT